MAHTHTHTHVGKGLWLRPFIVNSISEEDDTRVLLFSLGPPSTERFVVSHVLCYTRTKEREEEARGGRRERQVAWPSKKMR